MNIISLFSGAGGLDKGFIDAGFNIELSVEINPSFCATYMYNHPNTICLNEDITKLNILNVVNDYIQDTIIDGVIAGIPCQSFSSIGYRKDDDLRNNLYVHFIDWVKYFEPNFYLIENVIGLMSKNNGKIINNIINKMNKLGYHTRIFRLNALDYGIPQYRRRIFLIGSKGKLSNLRIPKTNSHNDNTNVFFGSTKPSYVKVKDAFTDILDIIPYSSDYENYPVMKYKTRPKSEYQEYLRKNSKEITNHFVPNHSKEVLERLSMLKQGQNNKDLPKEYCVKGGYSNIYGRLEMEGYASTITGNCGCVSSSGRFVHPIENRALSVRECSRLQSFKDSYKFYGSLNEMYKQVGNAVPPLLAFNIAKNIYKEYN